MTDFPRGWTLTNFAAAGVAATITAPAIGGVVHVLDSFYFRIVQSTGAAASVELDLTSSDGTFAAYVLTILQLSAVADDIDSDSASGLDLAAGPGASLTVFGSAAVAGVYQFLRIQGHDI